MSHLTRAENPTLSFFNEQESADLGLLFSDSTLIPTLQNLNAEIRMGMLDLSRERADIIRRLNSADIPVVAWLLLPKEKGYWFHSGNAKEAFERYEEIKTWAMESGIQFSGIGIDLEMDINDLELFKTNKLKLFGKILKRLYSKEEFLKAKEQYENLIETIRNDGYSIESYYIPIIRYETEKGQTALQQISKFMDLKTDKDIPMLYTSFMGNPYGTLKVLAIDEHLEFVALGSTGGGFDPSLPSMTWDELAYDLRMASKTAKEIHVFSLEATAEKGFLSKLVDFNYAIPTHEYPEQVDSVNAQISGIMWVSTILSYPTLMFTCLILILGLLIWPMFRLMKFANKKIQKSHS